ncbi:hypothetical protein COB57_05425 [Candidatus Peregrinibacteria bacterium]|nr:MAG: hypothetical protein COB57_05425 [Candidatus Peregrinibacteria bacterium]
MSKEQLRLYTKDEKGNTYKFLGVFEEVDKFGEMFIKIIFLIKNVKTSFYTKIDKENRKNVDIITEQNQLYQELTYHYQTGFVHGKSKTGKRDDPIRAPKLNIIQNSVVVKLMEVLVNDNGILNKEKIKGQNYIIAPIKKNKALLVSILFSFNVLTLRSIYTGAEGYVSEKCIFKMQSGLNIYLAFNHIKKDDNIDGVIHKIKPIILSQ